VVPQASIEFEVEDAEAVTSAAGELERAGYQQIPRRPIRRSVPRLLQRRDAIVRSE